MTNLAKYAIIVSLSVVVPINPVIVFYLTGSRSTAIYAGLIDLYAIVILIISIGFIRRRSKTLSFILAASLVGAIPALMAGEIAYVYARNTMGDSVLGIKKSRYMQPDDVSLYSLVPNAVGVHESPGNYKVKYFIDELGRKRIEQNPLPLRTLHFFGDSFTFGYGVTNDDTALNLLAKRLDGRVNVQNYGVGGYGIELMYLRFTEYLEEIMPGDVVIFSPTAIDMFRGWPGRSQPCGMMLRQGNPDVFPRIVRGKVEYVNLKDECNLIADALLLNTTFHFSIGQFYKHLRRKLDHREIIDAADDIFAQAERLAIDRGATFQLVFLPMPVECERQELALDLSDLETPYISLLQFCPNESPSIDSLDFPTDMHWSPFGNRWAAETLHQALGEFYAVNTPVRESN